MPITKLTINGYRGFASQGEVRFALPNGNMASGLTVITGTNNSGKSTVMESLALLSKHAAPTFTEGKRNKSAGDRVVIRGEFGDTLFREIKTVSSGGSQTEITGTGGRRFQMYVLPSRRSFSPFFGRQDVSREQFVSAWEVPASRNSELSGFTGRLFRALDQKSIFSPVLERLLGRSVDWTIDQNDSGQYFVKFRFGSAFHNSDGAGDGLMGAFCLADAFYDSGAGDIVAIDEPELSMHPSLQRRAFQFIRELTRDRQIILSTHSPYFIPPAEDCGIGETIRVASEPATSKIYQPSQTLMARLAGFATNLNNPHIFGFDAKQILLGEDGIVLVEGQEDVICYRIIAAQLGHQLADNFWGWGVGGAGNMALIADILKELGFKKVVGILDANHASTAMALQSQFSNFKFYTIPTDDVRTKSAIAAKPAIVGLLDANHQLDPSHRTALTTLFDDTTRYLTA